MEQRLTLIPMSANLKYSGHIIKVTTLIKKSVLEAFPLINSMKHNLELIHYICNLIETLLKPSPSVKNKICKQDLVIQILRDLMPCIDTEVEIQNIRRIIDFIHSSGSIIAVSKTAMRLSFVSSFLKKKFL
jgi:hypothetical protein